MTDKQYTHLVGILDRSGSMTGIARDMDGGMKQLLKDQAKEPGYTVVDIVTFDTEIETPYEGVRPDDVKGDLIVPRGGTALNDALGQTIVRLGEKFAEMKEQDRPDKVIVVVATDGMENSSKEYHGFKGTARIKEMIEHQKQEYGWTFIFLATGIDAFATADAYAFDRGSTIAFAASSAGVNATYDALRSHVHSTRAGDSYEFTEAERAAASSE